MTGLQEFTLYGAAVGAVQLAATIRLLLKFHSEEEPEPERFPPVSVLVPCKGLPPGFDENAACLLDQDYPGPKEYIFVAAEQDAPALARVRALPCRTEISDAKPERCSETILNLLHAVNFSSASSEVLVFADQDIRVERDWLRRIVVPLEDPGVGASSSCFLYLGPPLSLSGLLRSVWVGLSHACLSLFPHVIGACWAIRRKDFDRWGVARTWERSLMQDWTVSRIVREQGLRVRFLLRAMPFTFEGCSFKEFIGQFSRWLAVTRVYGFGWWLLIGVCLAFKTAVWAWALAPAVSWPLVILLLFQDSLNAGLLFLGYGVLMPGRFGSIGGRALGAALAAPLLHPLQVLIFLRSAFMREVRWGGRTYILKGPSDIAVREDPS